jgi:hypothetical protein
MTLIKKLFCVVILLATTPIFAQKLSYSLTTGEYNLKSHYLSYRAASYYIALNIASDDFIEAKSIKLNSEHKFSDISVLNYGIKISNENSISGLGFNLGYSYDIEWTESLTTSLWSDFSYTIYFEQTDTSITRGTRSVSTVSVNTFSQQEITIGLDQTLTDWFFVGLSYTKFTYNNNEVSKLDDGLSTTDSIFSNLDFSITGYISASITERLNIELSYTKTEANLVENNSTSKSATLYFDISKNITINGSISKKEYIDSDDQSMTFGLSWSF